MNRGLLSSENPRWGTPGKRDGFFAWLQAAFGFTLDPCAERWSAKCDRYFTEKDNGLAQSWAGEVAFYNPPYGKQIGEWVRKARHETMFGLATCVGLLPARVDTDWWVDYVTQRDGIAGSLLASRYEEKSRVLWLRFSMLTVGIYHHDARLQFELPPGSKKSDGESAPFPSSVVVFDPPARLRRRWSGVQKLSRTLRGTADAEGRPPLTVGRER
jgi:phage N-6-adenine-methyltransferase